MKKFTVTYELASVQEYNLAFHGGSFKIIKKRNNKLGK